MLIVANKIDLLSPEQIVALPHTQQAVSQYQQKEKFHIDDLKNKIYHTAIKDKLTVTKTW